MDIEKVRSSIPHLAGPPIEAIVKEPEFNTFALVQLKERSVEEADD